MCNTERIYNLIAILLSQILTTSIIKHISHESEMGDSWCPTHMAEISYTVLYKKVYTGVWVCVGVCVTRGSLANISAHIDNLILMYR